MYKKLLPLLMFSLATSVLKSQPISSTEAPDTSLIAFTADTQAPMWIESLWMKSHNNRAATKKLFNHISERRPGSLFILGDVVNLGYSNRQWKPIDNYISDLRNRQIEVHAILGNHEVMGKAKAGERNFQQRFPAHVRTGYVQVKDSVAIVLLNSNFSKLTKREDEQQVAWYKKTLEMLDEDPAIQFIITGCHHSPFTNSKIVGPSKAVQERFISSFLKSKKSRLFLSGHCHGFEHFKVEGKDFMVIGGGGGLNQPLKKGEGTIEDLANTYKPLFHYLTIRRLQDGLEVTSHKLSQDFMAFEQGFQLNIPVSAKPSAVFSTD